MPLLVVFNINFGSLFFYLELRNSNSQRVPKMMQAMMTHPDKEHCVTYSLSALCCYCI